MGVILLILEVGVYLQRFTDGEVMQDFIGKLIVDFLNKSVYDYE
jgi:hypothetical protein